MGIIQIEHTPFDGVKIVLTQRFDDVRGHFSESWNRRDFAAAGIDLDFVQDNHVCTELAGTVRGLHFQIEPFAQAKLVRVLRGKIFDIVVDVRIGSPTFGRHLAIELSADDGRQLFVPAGFAHGYCTLVNGVDVAYKTTNYYSPPHERGLAWDDPDIAICWPVAASLATVSDRDRALPRLATLKLDCG